MSAEFLLAWWNLLFVVPFLLAVTYLAVYAFSGVTFGETDAEMASDLSGDMAADLHAELDHDVDGGLEHDVDADADADVDHDVETTTESGDAEHEVASSSETAVAAPATSAHEVSIYAGLLAWIGLGRAPLSILLMVLLISWGVIGFVTNVLLAPVMPWPWMAVFGSLPTAAAGSLLITRSTVRLVAKWLPTMETYARPTGALVGSSGEALYNISERFGIASVRDSRGDLFQVACRVYPGDQPIAKGTQVLLVDYNDGEKCFFVTPYDVLEFRARAAS